jgi:hypothetical protein
MIEILRVHGYTVVGDVSKLPAVLVALKYLVHSLLHPNSSEEDWQWIATERMGRKRLKIMPFNENKVDEPEGKL